MQDENIDQIMGKIREEVTKRKLSQKDAGQSAEVGHKIAIDKQQKPAPVNNFAGPQKTTSPLYFRIINKIRSLIKDNKLLFAAYTRFANFLKFIFPFLDPSNSKFWLKKNISALSRQIDSTIQRIDATNHLLHSINQRIGTMDQQVGAMDQRIGTMDQQVGAMDQRIGTMDQQIGAINQQIYDHKCNILDQQRRISILLEEARKRFPEPISQEQLGNMLSEEDHLLDAMYATFEDIFRGTRADIKQRQSIYLPYIENAKMGTENTPIIDLGCGRGEWIELLKENKKVAKGIDINRIFISSCHNLGLDVVEQDAIAYLRELKSNSVGAITAFHLIEHLPLKTLIAMLDESLRVLKPGGLIILETPNPENVKVGSCDFYFDPTHRNPIPPNVIKYILEARGFIKSEILRLHPVAKEIRSKEIVENCPSQLTEFFYGPQDYSIIAKKA